jgi:hypothetical protein
LAVGILSRAKSAAMEQAVGRVLKSRLERYGELRQLNIDSEERRFSGEVLLRGETEPLLISEGHYRLEDRGGEPHVVVYGVKVSREWAQNAVDDHLSNLAFKVPDFLRSLI